MHPSTLLHPWAYRYIPKARGADVYSDSSLTLFLHYHGGFLRY
jgi:hypothetical protein